MEGAIDKQGWPLKWLNLVVMPAAVVLTIVASSFWPGLVAAVVIGAATAALLAGRYLLTFRRQVAEMKTRDPLNHLRYTIELAGIPQGRFVAMQALTGALVGAMWFALAFGIASLR